MASLGLHIHLDGIREAEKRLEETGKELNSRKYLDLIGMTLLRWSHENFKKEGAQIKWPPLSKNTIAARRKKSRKPLQDTGRLRQSFVYEVHRSGEWVAMGSKDKRAPWHHFGTGPRDIVPRRRKFLSFKTASGWVFTKRVKNHRVPARPLLPSQRLGRIMALKCLNEYVRKILRKAT